jgi:hypothetical protein
LFCVQLAAARKCHITNRNDVSTWQTFGGGEPGVVKKIVKMALDLGYRHFDTAAVYLVRPHDVYSLPTVELQHISILLPPPLADCELRPDLE